MAVTTIEIVPEQHDDQPTLYRAIQGDREAVGATPGQALDSLDRMLAAQGVTDLGTVVVIQRFHPDAFFTAQQQARLQELMDKFHDGLKTGHDLSAEEKKELEQLVDAEWRAAITRVPLFNPRLQTWEDHFDVKLTPPGYLEGKTTCGRATIDVLRLNAPLQLLARAQWIQLRLFP